MSAEFLEQNPPRLQKLALADAHLHPQRASRVSPGLQSDARTLRASAPSLPGSRLKTFRSLPPSLPFHGARARAVPPLVRPRLPWHSQALFGLAWRLPGLGHPALRVGAESTAPAGEKMTGATQQAFAPR